MVAAPAMQTASSLDSSQHSQTTGTIRGASTAAWKRARPHTISREPAACILLTKGVWGLPGDCCAGQGCSAKTPRLTSAALQHHNRPALHCTDGMSPKELPFHPGCREVGGHVYLLIAHFLTAASPSITCTALFSQ